MSSESGFSFLELIVVVAIVGVVAAVGIGMSAGSVTVSKGETAAAQLDGFLKRHREIALARRRDIEIRFEPPSRVRSFIRAGMGDVNPQPQLLETLTLEGGVGFRLLDDVPDTPNAFGNGVAIALGGREPVMFASEGMFMDVAANPVNATLSLAIENEPLSVTAVTILGATATIERWRWNGAAWTK